MKEIENKDVLAAALIAGAQAVEHYEIARYGTLCAWAKELGFDDSLELLLETLAEEKKTDALLPDLAEQRINKKAALPGRPRRRRGASTSIEQWRGFPSSALPPPGADREQPRLKS